MKTGSKFVTVFLWILIVLATVAMVGGGGYYLYGQLKEDDGEENRPSHEIVVSENIEVLSDRTLNISPEVIDGEGNPVLGKFSYEYEEYEEYIRITDGVISVLKPYDGEIEVTIKEENTGLEKTVAVKIVTVLSDVLKVQMLSAGEQGEVAEDLNDQSLAALTVGESYQFEVITMPTKAAIEDYFTLTATDGAGTAKKVFETSVSENRITLTVVGAGSGEVNFALKNADRGLDFSLKLPFTVSFEDEAFNESVLKNGDELLSDTEIASIQTLVFDDEVDKIESADWDRLTSLKKVVFELFSWRVTNPPNVEPPVVQVTNLEMIGENVVFRVNGLDVYKEYVASQAWAGRIENVYPYIDDPEKAVVVYHNEGAYALSGKIWEKNALYELGTETEFDFVTGDEQMLNADNVEEGYSVRTLTHEGYTFTGWKDGEGASFTDEDLSAIKEGIHVYAGWTANEYEVTLDGLYADGTQNQKVTVAYDQGVPTLSDGEKAGWNFEGWYLSDEYKETEKIQAGFIYRVEGDKTLYAKYSASIELSYTVKADGENITSFPIVYGKTPDALPVSLTAGLWTFGGWYESEEYLGDGRVTATEAYTREGKEKDGFSHTLYSKFTYPLAFDTLEIGETEIEDLLMYGGLTIEEALQVERKGRTWDSIVAEADGWTFKGWTAQTYYREENRVGFLNSGLDSELITEESDDCTLNRTVVYAIYEAEDTYLYGTNGEKSFAQTVVYGCKTYLPYTDEEINERIFLKGYTFAGWYLGDIEAKNNLFIGAPQTYAAKYNAVEYTVTFLKEDDAQEKTAKYYDVGTSVTDNVLNNDTEGLTGRTIELGDTPSKTGYTGYWAYGKENVGVESWTVPAEIFENITLQATYTANKYQVSFDMHGVGSVAPISVTFDQKYGTLPTPTKPTGFETFVGWFTDTEYKTQVTEDTVYKTDGNTTLFAKYQTTITLHLFTGTDPQTVDYASPYAFGDLADPDGRWTFAGWYYLDGEEEVPVSSVDSFTLSVKHYYSRWIRPITLVAGEGFKTESTLIVERGKSIEGRGVALPTDGKIEKTGNAENWELSHWYYLADGVKTTVLEKDKAIVENTTVTAFYAEYSSTVTVKIEYKSADGNLATVQTRGYSVTLGEEFFETLTKGYADELKADEPYGFYFNGWKVGEDTKVYTQGVATLALGKQTVYAQFDAAKYTLTYGANGGVLTGGDEQTAYCDEAFALLSAPTRTGYTFKGWQIGETTYEAGQTVVNLSYENGGEVTATAVWQANTYTVRYDLNGGAGEVEPYEATYDGESFALAKKPTREGYEFDKWTLNGKEYAAGATVNNLASEQGAEVTFVAKWTANSYTVVYDEAGGSEVKDTPAVYDTAFTLGAASERAGYTFGGWEIEGTIYQAGATIEENLTAENGATITATAIWETIEYKIVYLDENGNEVGVSEYTYTIESTSYPQPAVPEKVGYTGKWDTSGLVTGVTFGDQTVYAVYTPLSYTVTYYADKTQIKQASYTIEQHEGMDDSQAPTEDELKEVYPNKGYDFKGWIKEGWTEWTDWTITHKKVYAEYSAIEYTLNFVDGENTSYGTATFTADDLAVATPSAPLVLGYEIEWDLTREGLLAAIQALGEDELTIDVTCKEKTAIVYKATVKSGGESYVYPFTVESLVENKLILSVPVTAEGYAYVAYGATIEEGEGGGALVLAIPALGDLLIEEKSSEYEYTFLLAFEGCDEELTTVVGNGESVLLPTPTKVGYAFAGWQYKGLTLVGVEYFTIGASENERVTLTALWTAIGYTVAFENCEKVTDQTVVAEISAAYDEEITLPVPERVGYLFAGWTIGDKVYAAGERAIGLTSEDGGVVTATANWTAIEYNVSYNANGGDQTPANHTATYGEWFKLPSYINKEGYRFAGWSVEGTEEPFGSEERVKDLAFEQGATVVLTANWTAITYTVVFDNSDIEDMVCEYGVEYAYPNKDPENDPEREGYMFDKWRYYKDGEWKDVLDPATETIFNFATEQGAVVVIRAEWIYFGEAFYELFFDTKGLTFVQTQTIAFGEGVTLPETAKDGYEFGGWKLGEVVYAAGDTFENTENRSTVILTAVWTAIEYTITFEGVTHTATYTVETAREEIEFPTEYAALEKTGYLCTWILPETLIGDIHAPLERKPISFTLTFALDGGTGDFADKTVYYETAIVLGEPTKEGFVFAGWKTDDGSVYSGTERLVAKFTAEDGTMVALTALWTNAIAIYTATFVANGVEVAAIEFTAKEFGKRLLAPAVPLRAENGEHYTGVWESYTLQASDLTIEAVYTPKAYAVEYYYQIDETDEKTVIHTAFYTVENSVFVLPSAPFVEGYLFVKFNEVQLNGGDKQVKAIYAPVTYTVSFDSDGGSEAEAFEVVYDQAFTLDQTPTKAGHTFAGWKNGETVYSLGEELKNLCAENGGSVVFTAVWTVNSYTLTYDLAGGSLDGELSSEVEYQATFTLLSVPTKDGYTFVGWSIDGQIKEAGEGLVYSYASHMTVAAVWSLIDYYVIFNGVPEANGGVQVWTVESGAVQEPSIGRTWKMKNEDGELVDYVLEIDSFNYNEKTERFELVLYSQAVATGASKIEFRLDDETLITTRYYTAGDTVAIPVVPTRTGYLGAWDISGVSSDYFTYQDGKITVKDGATGDVKIYASYTPITYAVSYLVDGEETACMQLKYDESFAHIDDPFKKGYVFGGWAFDGEKYEGDLVNLCQNEGGRVEFTAIFTPIKYTVEYHSLGGDLTPESVTAIYDQAFALPESAGVYAGKEFVGWRLEGTDTVYAAGEAAINLTASAGAVNMYAQWIDEAHTATFVDENGSTVGTAIFRGGKFVDESSIPAVPEKAYYTGEWDIPTLGASDVTAYAVYTPVRYTATFVVDGETVGSAFYTVESAPSFPVLTKEHYTLVWSDTAFDGGDKTVTGEYKAIEYTLTFYKTEGGEEVVDEVVYRVDNVNVTLPAVPSGYAAWHMPVLDGGDKSVYPIAAVENGYIVTFVDSAQKTVTSIVLKAGEALTETLCPAVPNRQGYTGVWVLPETVDGDVTIEPKYTEIEYTVTFLDEDGSVVGETTYTVNDDNIDVPAVPEKAHYTGDWALPELTYGNVTVYPVYVPIVYTVTFYREAEDVGQADKVFAVRTYTIETPTITLPAVPEKEGYEASGTSWDQTEYSFDKLADYLTDISIYAVYDSFNIYYEVDGEIKPFEPSTGSITNGFTTAKSVDKTGYKFSWALKGTEKAYKADTYYSYEELTDDNGNQVSGGSVTFVAKWTAIKYVITFDENGGEEVDDIIVTYDQPYELPLPTCTGYVFNGWIFWDETENKVCYGAGTRSVNFSSTDGDTVEAVAWWSAIRFTITYNLNGGTSTKPSDQTEYYDNAFKLASAPTWDGYTFGGWAIGNATYDAGAKVSENLTTKNGAILTATAIWTPNQYKVKFFKNTDNKDDGKITLSKIEMDVTYTKAYGDLSTPSSSTYTRSEKQDGDDGTATYTFKGWYYNSSGTGSEVTKDTILNAAMDHNLYAKWDRTWTKNTCFATGSLVLMADGTRKTIENIKTGDFVMSWNFILGKFEAMPVSLYWDHGESVYDIVNLCFSNGEILRVIAEHGFFDYSLNKFVFISKENYAEYIGHTFVSYGVETYELVTLEKAYITTETTGCYSLRTACNDNAIVGSMLTLTFEDFEGFLTYFEVGENLKYDKAKMQADIQTYGLYTYEEWSEYVTYEEFVALNGQYYKILIGKGIITYEDIFTLMAGMRNINQ